MDSYEGHDYHEVTVDSLVHFNAYGANPSVDYTARYRLHCPVPRDDSAVGFQKFGSTYYFKDPEVPSLSILTSGNNRGYSAIARVREPMYYDPTILGPVAVSSPPDMASFPTTKMYAALDSFRDSVRIQWRDIVPASMFSAVKALQEVQLGTSTDVLQTLYKLPGYRDMLPKVIDAVKILGDIYRRDLSASTIREVLDLASATTLQANFQWRPVSQLVTTELPKIARAVSVLTEDRKVSIGRGSWSFDFAPNTFGRDSSHLLVRTKIVLDVSSRSLAASLLGYDALGIIPKPSNLWDLLPFTFIVNWFTGVGPAIRRAEYSLLMSTLPAYYVHTYAITSPLTSNEMTLWSMSSSLGDSLSMKEFDRDVSHFSPLPRDSKFGFGIPTELPSLGVLGSLLYQLFGR